VIAAPKKSIPCWAARGRPRNVLKQKSEVPLIDAARPVPPPGWHLKGPHGPPGWSLPMASMVPAGQRGGRTQDSGVRWPRRLSGTCSFAPTPLGPNFLSRRSMTLRMDLRANNSRQPYAPRRASPWPRRRRSGQWWARKSPDRSPLLRARCSRRARPGPPSFRSGSRWRRAA
jgi:hypothetical protein